MLKQKGLHCCSEEVAGDRAQRLDEKTAQSAFSADEEDFGVFLLAVAETKGVDCETVEDENEDDGGACRGVDFVGETEVAQQLDLDEAVEGEFHDVGLNDHHEQTPPNQRGPEAAVDSLEEAAVPSQNLHKEQERFRGQEQKCVEEEVGLVGVLGGVGQVDASGVAFVVGPEQRPVLEVGVLLDGVGSDLLDEAEEAQREGVESDDVGQVHVVEDRLQELRVVRVVAWW